MKLDKKYRQSIFEKFGGKCSFCGYNLDAGWHIWDVLPIQIVVTESGQLEKTNTEADNLMPACKECGSVRIKNTSGKMDIEAFRKEIHDMYIFARDSAMYSSSVKRALKFGLISETGKSIKFYFENKQH